MTVAAFLGIGTIVKVNGIPVSEVCTLKIGKIVSVRANYVPTDKGQIEIRNAITSGISVEIEVIFHWWKTSELFRSQIDGYVDVNPREIVGLYFSFDARKIR